ncbi:peptide/nickel transport system permease protein [Pullulanibacillus pueri]|uniref:ABC transporter permease n=1 Tax=Pullulanibacillus pueri TaxID=1437324 RepID=A0A8J3EM91_9BACL|nr:ABC transporter permease [Pullulanibacillus pueri]MBM7682639.1 peptide/nickel transport system permease protein [Pullulanibacillus pueri]GGH82612.1 ABC transporter permease [Pullulanibacillus pueri]
MKWINRIIMAILTVFVVASLTFFLVRLMPGSPVQVMYLELIQKGIPANQAMNQVNIILNVIPNEPLFQQYIHWLGQIIHGDMGQSIQQTGVPVIRLIFNALPWTLITVAIGLLISFFIGVLLGVLSAFVRERWTSSLIDNIGSVAHAIPQFVTAVALLYIFSVLVHWFPSSGAYSIEVFPGFNGPFIMSFLYHMALPVFTYVLTGFGAWTLQMKASTVSVLKEDFMMAARLRGLKQNTIMGYLGSNSILPLFTGLMLSLGAMFGGSVFIEGTYAFPGIGNLLATAINTRDYPVMQGCFILTTATIIFANLIADFAYTKLDPRITD